MFGKGSANAVSGFAVAAPGQGPALSPLVERLSHLLRRVAHSVIDVFSHSADFCPSPVL
jgi:hypothetical protein